MIDLAHISLSTLGYAFVGGLLPALIWLYFLLREDTRAPEPRWLILLTFLVGMLAVPLAIPLESIVREYAFGAFPECATYARLCFPTVLGWAAIEEGLKYSLLAFFILWRSVVDEPVDLVIYMLTGALGFAALENMLFLIEPFGSGQVLAGLATGNLRFIGSMLLHVIASSAIGFSLGFAFFMPPALRTVAVSLGLILAIALHTVFNFFIIRGEAASTLFAFFIVWMGAVVFFALFEILKYFEYRHSSDLPAIT